MQQILSQWLAPGSSMILVVCREKQENTEQNKFIRFRSLRPAPIVKSLKHADRRRYRPAVPDQWVISPSAQGKFFPAITGGRRDAPARIAEA